MKPIHLLLTLLAFSICATATSTSDLSGIKIDPALQLTEKQKDALLRNPNRDTSILLRSTMWNHISARYNHREKEIVEVYKKTLEHDLAHAGAILLFVCLIVLFCKHSGSYEQFEKEASIMDQTNDLLSP